ncbi:MAG: DUF58 domain-containing protein [Candidatus Eremiobacteraeota bacterium]|nr:DUF58 domain-containing protein [Candidatus Eremiobacteraeota bacterium]
MRGYFPLTAAGLGVTAAIGLAFPLVGIARLDLVVVSVALAAAAVLCFSVLVVCLSALWLRRRLGGFSRLPIELTAQHPCPTGISLSLPSYLPMVKVEWEWEDLDAEVSLARQAEWVRERVNCRRRGIYPGVVRRFTVRDVLGLASLTLRHPQQVRIRVLQATGRLESVHLVRSLLPGDDIPDPAGEVAGERLDMRGYQRGDSVRFILWKVYSRSGKVMVRVPERAITSSPRACAYLLTGPNDEASAGLARVLVSHGLLGAGWRFGADGATRWSHRADEALEQIAASGNRLRSTPAGLATFLKEAETDGFGYCIVLAPAGSVDAARLVEAAVRFSRLRVDVWVGVDQDLERPARGVWKWLERRPPAQPNPEEVFRRWGGRATVVARFGGVLLEPVR